MSVIQIVILAVIQGLAELLPVSSSAHVIAAAKFLHLDPTTPPFVLLLVMLHTGTMFAVIVYFWRAWKRTFFQSQNEFIRFATKIAITTAITGVLGYGMQKVIKRYQDPGYTRLESWKLSVVDVKHPLPNGKPRLVAPALNTRLTDLVTTDSAANAIATGSPILRLFKVGEALTLNVKKDGEPLPYESIDVKPAMTVSELLAKFKHGFAINTADAPGHSSIPKPGVRLIFDKSDPSFAQIEVVGNMGRENRYKLADGFTDGADQVRIGFADTTKGEVEQLFKRMDLIAIALAAAGVVILFTGIAIFFKKATRKGITTSDSVWLGLIQALCLPFRGFSRSGVTISLGLLRGITRQRAEEFSFAMAVVLTPPLIIYEGYRLYEHQKQTTPMPLPLHAFVPGLMGMVLSFLAGLVALKLLSKLLEKGQWWLFGVYCLAAASGVYWMHLNGFGN